MRNQNWFGPIVYWEGNVNCTFYFINSSQWIKKYSIHVYFDYANFTKQILISLSGILSLSGRINGVSLFFFALPLIFFHLVRLLFILFLVVLCATSIFSYNLCVFLFGIALCTVENFAWFSLTMQKTFLGLLSLIW